MICFEESISLYVSDISSAFGGPSTIKGGHDFG
jgi:hypothetical protein